MRAPTSAHVYGVEDMPKVWPYSSLALVQANKQTYREALGLYYSQNKFVFYFPLQATMFLQAISRERASHIKAIELWYVPSYNQGGMNLFDLTITQISQLPKLSELTLLLDGSFAQQFGVGGKMLPSEERIRGLKKSGVKITVRCPAADTILFHRLDEAGNETPRDFIRSLFDGLVLRLSYAQKMLVGAQALQEDLDLDFTD